MSKELPNILTPTSSQDLLYAFAAAWKQLFNELPTKNTLCVLAAQVQLECGVGMPYCHCFNFGNIKATSKDETYTYYKCNEIVPASMGAQMIANCNNDGGKAYITSKRPDGKVVIWFEPKNKYCKFKAYETKEQGAVAHLTFLKNRYVKYPALWDSIITGDPQLFAHYLKVYKYYTADESLYTRGVMRIYTQMQKLEYDHEKIQLELTNEEKENIINSVVMNLDNYSRSEILYDDSITSDNE